MFFIIVLVLIAAVAILRMNTKKHSPVEKISTSVNGANIEIVYCRPSKKGRVIFGEPVDEAPDGAGPLQPWGRYWRLGANEATTIEVSEDIDFAGQTLKAGKYSMYAVPRKDTWTIAINSVADRWGYSEPDYDKDVLSATVPVEYSDEITEMFTMAFETTETGADLKIMWDTSNLRIPIH